LKEGPRSVSRIAAPIKNLAQRFAYLTLVLSTIALMFLGKIDTVVVERVRVIVTDSMAPILDAVSRPVEAVNKVIQEAHDLYALRLQNTELKTDRERLLQWQAVARRLEAENETLRGLLNFVPDRDPGFVTARVIADTGGSFANSLILNAGDRAGIRKGQAAVSGEGLVGRVADVGRRSSRLLLVTDINSRIPIMVQPGGARAIMAGNNTGTPKLVHLSPGFSVAAGDRVVTSGHGGAFPQGLPVGVVASNNENGIAVQPYTDQERLQYVRILDYGLTGIIEIPPTETDVARPRGGGASQR